MDNSQQGNNSTWSSTEDKKPALSRSNSPHPPQYQDPVSTGLTVDPALASANPYSASDSATTGTDESLSFTTPYLSSTSQNPELLLPTSVPQPESFNSGQGYSNSFQESFVAQLKAQGDEFTSLLNSDFNMYPTDNNQNANFNDPSMMFSTKFDAAPQQAQQQSYSGNPSINPADLSRISSPHNPTSPPHLVPPDPVPSPRAASPVSSPGAYYTPQHSRHASLDPVTAAYMTSQQQQSSDWQGLLGNPSFQGHRRAPSEHSDVSSVHSPFLGHHDSFDGLDNSHSPLLTPQNDPSVYENSFGMESFSISDHQAFSPAHSPYNVSPRLGPQPPHHGEPPVDNSFHLTQRLNTQLGQGPSEQYVAHIDTSPHPTVHSQHSPGDIGQAAQMTPPSINVEFAPPSRTSSFGPPQEGDNDTLSPPSRSRGRSKSDPFAITRPMTSTAASGVLVSAPHDPRSLSPFSARSGNLSTPSSRDVSPAAKHRRQSTSSVDSRSYILDLANPQRPGASSGDSKRVQKHPATFQCNLCPKRFTRAYNLRSHLRTHTDERPFVCTVCGKAFARQHDRKRHEGLHSGEKKFVCHGDLGGGGHWGCGRRFARADALGRHFRSEAGRVCIKPLLDEEAVERDNRAYASRQQHLQPLPQPLPLQTEFALPAALLAQYPALQTLQWDQIPNQPPPDDASDMGGNPRSSFDASSGGEYGFGDDDESGVNNGYIGGPGPTLAPPHTSSQGPLLRVHAGGGPWPQQSQQGWQPAYEPPR